MFLEQPAELTHVSFIILQQLLQSIWDKVFKNGLSKICGRQPFKFFGDCLPQFYVVHSWILFPILELRGEHQYEMCEAFPSRHLPVES